MPHNSQYYKDPWSREYSFKENDEVIESEELFEDDVFQEALSYLSEDEISRIIETLLSRGYPKESLRKLNGALKSAAIDDIINKM